MVYGDVMFQYSNRVYRTVHENNFTLYSLSYTNIPHQGTFVKRSYLEKLNGYNENYKIISDWFFLLKAFIEFDLQIRKINIVISYFDMYGLSNTEKNSTERDDAINRYYPFMNQVFDSMSELRDFKLSTVHKYASYLVKIKKKLSSK